VQECDTALEQLFTLVIQYLCLFWYTNTSALNNIVESKYVALGKF